MTITSVSLKFTIPLNLNIRNGIYSRAANACYGFLSDDIGHVIKCLFFFPRFFSSSGSMSHFSFSFLAFINLKPLNICLRIHN